ncbi:MAG: hypothetical protein Q4G58_00565 [bacterium]|nr:hypothetical protein [bacterium]
MSSKIKSRRLNASMLEIICTLGILVVVSVLLLKLFLGANSLETKARDISEACILAESMAETIKGSNSIEEALKTLKVNQIQDNYTTSIYEKYYDTDWKPVKKKSRYRVTLTVEQQTVGEHVMYMIGIVVKSEKSYPIIKKEDGHILADIQVSSYK